MARTWELTDEEATTESNDFDFISPEFVVPPGTTRDQWMKRAAVRKLIGVLWPDILGAKDAINGRDYSAALVHIARLEQLDKEIRSA